MKNFKRYRNFDDAKGRCIASDSCDTNMAFRAKYNRRNRRNRKFRRREFIGEEVILHIMVVIIIVILIFIYQIK